MTEFDVAIIGGGIVGLATAYQVLQKRPGLKLLLLEKESKLAAHQTGRNSGVIHSGIYYKPGSHKATNCRRGYQQLIRFCKEHGISHEICGKIILATSPDELARLDSLHRRGTENGLRGLRMIDSGEINEIEPFAQGIRALHVPETGIIDYIEFSQKLAHIIQNQGGLIVLENEVHLIVRKSSSIHIETDKTDYQAKALCCCAGLQSDRLARQTHPKLPLRILPFRGEYYKIRASKRTLVNSLIYPVPDPAFPFLGVHFTRMVSGEIEAGPNAVLALGRESYAWKDINFEDLTETLSWPGFWKLAQKHWKMGGGEIHRSLSKRAFTRALQRLIPSIQESDLVPAEAGNRAQACHRDGSLLDDFHIEQSDQIIHICNAPSPAATASLAIGEKIAERVGTLLS